MCSIKMEGLIAAFAFAISLCAGVNPESVHTTREIERKLDRMNGDWKIILHFQ